MFSALLVLLMIVGFGAIPFTLDNPDLYAMLVGPLAILVIISIPFCK